MSTQEGMISTAQEVYLSAASNRRCPLTLRVFGRVTIMKAQRLLAFPDSRRKRLAADRCGPDPQRPDFSDGRHGLR